MSQLIVGDYIEHWESGIGQIIDVNESSVIVNFEKGNKDVTFPKKKTTYFKKLNPVGLYAKLYENKEYVENLIQQGSTEIIKLLIMDEAAENKRELEISRIKSLLMIGGQSDRGWRKDFGLIKGSDWEKWWQKINKNMSNDPWFDTSLKPFIFLREQPISIIENIYNQFVAEKIIVKKLRVSEKLIDLCDINNDASILQEIRDFIEDIIITNLDVEIVHISTYYAILLAKKGISLKSFNDRAYELSFKALANSVLPSSNLALIYMFFSALPIRNINDQILILICVNKKMRKIIVKYLKSTEYLNKSLKDTKPKKYLTELHIDALNHLTVEKREEISSGLTDYLKLYGNESVSKLIIDILLITEVDIAVRDIFARFALQYSMTNVIYAYFNNIIANNNENIPFFSDFLRLLGSENAEIVYKQILLSVQSLSERPGIFLAALKNLSTDSSGYLNNTRIQSLISHVNDILRDSKISINSDLKLEIIRTMTNTHKSGEVKFTYDKRELSNIVKMKIIKTDKRIKAITLLISQGFKDDCIDLVRDLIIGINQGDIVILENIFKAFPDEKLVNDVFVSIIEQISIPQEELITSFRNFIINTNTQKAFSDLILTYKDDGWFEDNSEKIVVLLNENNISRYVISLGLREYFLKEKSSPSIMKRLSIICSKYSVLFLEAIRNIYLKEQEGFKNESKIISEKFIDQINRTIDEHESQRIDAINRTSQRYEEYLQRIVPLLQELEALKDKIKTDSIIIDISKIQSELIDKITTIKQDIEGILKILGIIDRE